GCRALGDEAVFHGVGVRVPQSHAADHDLILRYAELPADHRVDVGESGLGTRVEAAAARRDGERADVNAQVQPAPDLEILVEGEDETDGRAEEFVIAAMLALGTLEVP